MSEEVKIGDTLYQFDMNKRAYDPVTRASIYAEHFRAGKIVGETPRSWLVDWGSGALKVSKKDLTQAGDRGYMGFRWYTEQGMADDIWKKDHRIAIEGMLAGATADQLRQIAAIVGYQP